MIKIYDINNKLLMQAEVTSAAKREQEMSKSDYISLSFSAAEKVILPVGAYINYTYKIDKVREVTRKFLLLESYEPTQSDECSWKYTPQFQHPKMILSKTPFFIYTRNSQNVEVKQNVWSFVGITSVLSDKIADFLNKDLMFGECGWKVIFSNVTANTVNVSFSDNDFISALTAITNAIGDNCEWHIDYDDEIIYIGKVLVGETPVVLEVGKNVGVPNITNSKEGYYNAFSIFGGTRNITQVNSKGENVSSGDIRLQLDEGNGTISIDGKERSYSIDKYSTLDLRADKTKEPLFTKVLDFSQIFPSLNTYVYNVRGRVKYVLDENNEKIPISNADGSINGYKTFTVWYMRLAYPTTEKVEGKTIINTTVDDGVTHYWYDFEITDNLLIKGKNIGCSFEANFNTGALSTPLAGHGSNGEYVGFELTYHKEASSSHTSDDVSDGDFSVLAGDYEIIYQEDNEVIIPTNAADMLIPRGESMPSLKCNITVLYNIAMADTIYYEDAQNRLLEKAKEEIVRLLSDLNNYEVKSYSDVFLEDNPQLQIGQSVTYKDGHGYELATRVLKLSTNIDYDFIQSITIGNQAIKGTITQLKEDVQTIIASGGSSGNGGGYSVSQLRSLIAKYGSDNFISKQFNDTAHGTITWENVQKLLKGLDIGDNKGAWSADGTLSLFRLLTNNFESGPYGHGAQIDEKGDMEVNSIYARQFISAPKFVFNEISVTKAEQWNTNGYGTIESVDVKNRTITLHLEENDYGSLQVGDICRGLYADIDNAHGADKIEEGALDDCNFVQHKGFFSTYFYVMHIITNEKGKFVFQYGKKSAVTPDPCAYMDFAQYGSFTDEKRQSSMYFSSRGNSYIEVLDGVKTWEVQSQNRVARYGWLGGLRVKKTDGTWKNLKGNGLFAQNNVYFGGNVEYLGDILGLDDMKNEAKAYDVSLSQYQSVITVDDMGNVINGLYTEDEAKTTKQYRISTAVFVRKGMDILLEEDGNTEEVTAGHYRVHAVSEDCEVMVQNSTIFVTAIRNIKDGVAGTTDDSNFDYDAMRKATDAMVTIVVELEGKTSKMVQMPIRIQHDTLPFMVCDLSNESASVAWNTKTAKYIGLPIKTKVSLMYHNEPWAISSLNISEVAGLKTSMSIEGKAKVITIDSDNLNADTLAQVTKMNITVVGRYAGANYEYMRELTILKSADTVVYELIPSADSVIIDNQGNMSAESISCDIWATSSDDKRYKLTELPAGYHLKHGTTDTPDTNIEIGEEVSVQSDASQLVFALYDAYGNVLDKESVPVLTCGADGDGYEYIYYRSSSSSASSIPTPRRQNGSLTNGWQDDPMPPTVDEQYVYVAYKKGAVGNDGTFSTPKLFNRYPKSISKQETRFYAWNSLSDAPDASTIWNYGTPTMPTDFNDSYPWLWKIVRTTYTDGTTDDVVSCEGYKAQNGIPGEPGAPGAPGVGIDSIQTYYLISSESSGIKTSSSGWSTDMVNPTSSKPYLWSYVKTTLSNGDFENSTPVIIGNFAEAGIMGENGCIIRPSIWKSGVVYLNESALTNKKEKYIDLVYVEDANDNDGWRQYMCALTHTSTLNNSPTSSDGSTYWTELSDTGPIYAPLILAKNAVLNFTQGQQFNLVENGKIFASYRIPGSDGAALWLGGSTASSAPFSVDKNGSLKSTSGIIGGVEISKEKLGVGVADAGNHTFTGAILSSGGLFTGYKSSYFGAGYFADYDPSDSKIQMYDQKALDTNPTQSVSSPSLYIRKYSPDSMTLNNIDKYYGAALIVDVPKGVGVASLGNNVLGGLALGAVASNLDIGSTDYLFQKNRGAVAYLTNSSECRFYLPANPHDGQVVIVIQGSTGKITFYHPGKRLVIQNTVKDSEQFYSGSQGQFNIFVYIGSMWYGTYCNG